jgi:hypothetical protein
MAPIVFIQTINCPHNLPVAILHSLLVAILRSTTNGCPLKISIFTPLNIWTLTGIMKRMVESERVPTEITNTPLQHQNHSAIMRLECHLNMQKRSDIPKSRPQETISTCMGSTLLRDDSNQIPIQVSSVSSPNASPHQATFLSTMTTSPLNLSLTSPCASTKGRCSRGYRGRKE